EPLKNWKKNGEFCKLDIIDPDITIEDRPLKHVTPAIEDSFKKHVDIFRRKMDKCFKGTESFIAVYIDDIMVFSKNEKEHAKHLEKMLKFCEDNGLVLSPTKMKLAVSTMDFLGAVIEEGSMKKQMLMETKE
nr:hypothetical protein [Tanacetum cinerariifolium]